MKRQVGFCSLLGFVLFLSHLAPAQDAASLTGTVRDQTGAVLASARVVITNISTNSTRTLTTNSDGEYLAAALAPGQYDITVTAEGFGKYQARTVTLRVAQNARIDVTLKVGGVNSEVTVQGEGLAKVNTQTSEMAGTITGKEIMGLQLNGRNFTQLITLVPGVSNQTGQDEGKVGVEGNVNYSVNGGRTENNNWEVDGGDVMDNGSNFSLNVYPSVEAIEEVQVLTSNYGAQYGKNASGTVEVETKSGTNAFHGSAYEFLRNEAFNAHYYFDPANTPKAPYKKHEFGYTLGGPIWKNHTFFFWSHAWRRENLPQNFLQSVPSTENRHGNFSDLCPSTNSPFQRDDSGADAYFPDCPGTAGAVVNDLQTYNPYVTGGVLNQIPFMDPNGQALLPMISQPTSGSGAASIFQASVGQPMHWREELFRIDHDFNSKLRATFRYIHDSWNIQQAAATWSGNNFPTIGSHFVGPGISMVARLSATVSPTLLNEFVASYTTDHIIITNTHPEVWQRGGDFTMTGFFPDFGGKLPSFCISTFSAYQGGFCAGPTSLPWNNSNPTYTYRDNVSKSWGKHNLQFGGYFAAAQKNEMAAVDVEGVLGFDSTAPVSTGNSFADLLMGNIANFSQDSAQPKYYVRYKLFEPYIQDDFHVRRNLTLNFGLRVSMFGTFREIKKQVANWDPAAYDPSHAPKIVTDPNSDRLGSLVIRPGTTPYDGVVQCGVAGVPLACMGEHLFNPAPRIGFAWDPFGDGKTSIRAAYGIFLDHTNGEEGNAETLEGTPPLVQEPTQYNVTGYTSIGGDGLLFPLSATSISSSHAIWPNVQQWHLDVQRDLSRNFVGTISYVGSKGTHLTLQRELNQLLPIPASDNPFQPGQPITGQICDSQQGGPLHPTFKVNGHRFGGQPAINLAIACENDPNPFRPYYSLGSLQRVEPQANSTYNSLQISLRRTKGPLTLGLAYTYSHSLDDSSDKADSNFVDSSNLKKNYASSNFDQRHILTVSWVYDLPFFRKPGLSRSLLGGWQFAGIMTAQSGEPFSVFNGVFGDSAGTANGVATFGSGSGSFADRVGDPNAIPADRKYDPNVKGPLLFNPDAYVQTQGLTYGNSGRNSLNMPHRTQFDMSLYKTFKPTEKVDVQFRTEAFNALNHTQFSGLNTWAATDNFMRAYSAHLQRVIQLALKVVF